MPYLYVLRCNEHYKIGITKTSVHKRVANMQTGNPFPIEIVSVFNVENYRYVEKLAYSEFMRYLTSRGWHIEPGNTSCTKCR